MTQEQMTELLGRLRDIKSQDRRVKFQVEEARGETYRSTRRTLYGYSVYPRSSVLSGQQRRTWIDDFDSTEEEHEFIQFAKQDGLRIGSINGDGYIPVNLSHLPDDTDY